MIGNWLLLVFATLLCIDITSVATQNQQKTVKIPRTRFTCSGRASGYYADVDTGCQVYHMCDGLGRQFSYSCPNTTLFQQRMLVCDHWYMVNCSKAERDYDANLLIGQRDKPFVSDAEMQFRTPRPDILSVPPNNNYYDGLKESETKFPIHPGNSIVGVADSISNTNNNGLDSAKQNYRPPTSWSTGIGNIIQTSSVPPSQTSTTNAHVIKDRDSITGESSQDANPIFQHTTAINRPAQSSPAPTQDLSPPSPPTTTESTNSGEFDLDIRMRDNRDDRVFKFIKRFDPNSPDSIKTAMTKSEILDLNKHLPDGQSSVESREDDRTPRKNKNGDNNFNTLKNEKKGFDEASKPDTVKLKPGIPNNSTGNSKVPVPDKFLQPPKADYSDQTGTTMGPPIYYEWKWAVPAFDLEPPKENNITNSTNILPTKAVTARSPFRDVTRPTPQDFEPTPSNINTEYNISSYFIPDYVFPLDKSHPGYESDDAETSFRVKIERPGRTSYGENPACPHCHPAYLEPGTCEPCIVKR